MKKTILAVILVGFSLFANSQLYKYRSEFVNFKFKDVNSTWGDWGDNISCDVFITLDFTKKRVTIYSDETQILDFISPYSKELCSNGDQDFTYLVATNDGEEAELKISYPEDTSYLIQFYIYYDKVRIVYNVKPVN